MEFVLPNWSVPKHVKALTTTRLGGVSQDAYVSLNLGDHVGDSIERVTQNREQLKAHIQANYVDNEDTVFEPVWLKQEHTTDIATDSTQDAQSCAYDGQFTGTKGRVCTIMTADCLPVFLSNHAGTEVALVHAGWRGLANGIVEQAIKHFSSPAEDLLVHCGPGISQRHFEIGHEVREQIGGSEHFYRQHLSKADHCYADLAGLLGERVAGLGVEYTQYTGCTYAEEQRFFSYRRDGVTGRMASFIWID